MLRTASTAEQRASIIAITQPGITELLCLLSLNLHVYMLWMYSMWSRFKHFFLLSKNNRPPTNDLSPHNLQYLWTLSISAFLILSTFYLTYYVCDKMTKLSRCSHCSLSALEVYFVVFILFYSIYAGSIKLSVPVLPLAGFYCLQPSVADYWICRVNKQKWNR